MNAEEIQAALKGPIASVRTPFTRAGEIDYAALRRCLDFSLTAGARTLLLTIGDSLYALLSDREIGELTQAVAAHVRGRAMVVACTARWATPQAVEFARHAHAAGADLLQVVWSQWYPEAVTVEGVVAHHTALGAVMPLMANTGALGALGHGPGLEAVRQLLGRVPAIIAAKADVTGPFDRRVTALVRDRWAVFMGGQKQHHLDLLPYGCAGYLSTFLTFQPEVARAYWRAIEHGRLERAAAIVEQIDAPFFDHVLKVRGGFDAALHGIYELYGLAARWRRPPFHSLTDAELDELRVFLEGLLQHFEAHFTGR